MHASHRERHTTRSQRLRKITPEISREDARVGIVRRRFHITWTDSQTMIPRSPYTPLPDNIDTTWVGGKCGATERTTSGRPLFLSLSFPLSLSLSLFLSLSVPLFVFLPPSPAVCSLFFFRFSRSSSRGHRTIGLTIRSLQTRTVSPPCNDTPLRSGGKRRIPRTHKMHSGGSDGSGTTAVTHR